MLKQSVLHTYQGILHSNKKKWTINTSNNQNEYPENYGKWEKKKSQSQNITYCYDSIYIILLEITEIAEIQKKLTVA